MANAKTYYIDPNVFLPTSQSGVAQHPGDRTAGAWTKLLQLLNNSSTNGAFETVDTTATNLAVDVHESQLQVSGTMTATLPDGTFAGQQKYIRCTSAASTPAMTLTITTPETASGFACAATWFFDSVGQGMLLTWTGTKWRALRVDRAGGAANAVVVGTTVLTGKNLWASYFCSVTGTVASTSTQGIPDGSAIGELCAVKVSTAASIPSGTITLACLTNAGAAGTTLGTMAATTNYAHLRWNGTKWEVVGNTTLVTS